MSNVSLEIGGRNFLVACADGEEDHVHELGREIHEKIAASGVRGLSETRMLLFAALMLADEVHELKAARQAPAQDDKLTEALEKIASRMENLAGLFETGLEPAPDHP